MTENISPIKVIRDPVHGYISIPKEFTMIVILINLIFHSIHLINKWPTKFLKLKFLIIENTDPENNNNFCKYYDTEDFVKAKFENISNFSVFHLNIASLKFHFEELKILLSMLNFEFDCIMITETKLQKNINPRININIPNYHLFHTPTEASKGGSLIYISNKLISKPRKDLEIYEPMKVESTFSEIIIPNGKNIIVGCVYKHHTIDPK